MSQETQTTIKNLAAEHGSENLLVILGGIDLELVDIMAETLVSGDPSFAGPLADVALNLEVYHILEPEMKALLPPEIYQIQIGAMEYTVDIAELSAIMKKWRQSRKALMQN